MADADSAQSPYQGGAAQGIDPRADLLDVLIRGLEMARQNIGTATEGGEEPLSLFCTYAYAEAGTLFCPLFYWHSSTSA